MSFGLAEEPVGAALCEEKTKENKLRYSCDAVETFVVELDNPIKPYRIDDPKLAGLSDYWKGYFTKGRPHFYGVQDEVKMFLCKSISLFCVSLVLFSRREVIIITSSIGLLSMQHWNGSGMRKSSSRIL